MESDFGKGFIYNFILFLNHMSNPLAENISEYNRAIKEGSRSERAKWWYEKIVLIWRTPEEALSWEIKTWMSGASTIYFN